MLVSSELVLHADNKKTLQQLLLNGANINYQAQNGWCLLFELAILGLDKNIDYFASQGMDLTLKDTKGRNVLFWAIHKKKLSVIKMLMHLGFNIHEDVYPSLSAKEYATQKNIKNIL